MPVQRAAYSSRPYEDHWPERCPNYATAVSAWGDTFVACGHIRELMRRTGAREIGVIYYGKHDQIPDFLRHQPWCREVIHRPQVSHDELMQIASYPDNSSRWDWMQGLLQGIDPADVWPTHIRWNVEIYNSAYLFRDALLPAEAWAAAQSIRAALPRHTYFLHPWSFQSCVREGQWPHWQRLVRWLLENTSATYVLTGHGYDGAEFGEHPRLVNLVGKTAHMHDALALACLCRGVITTCNSFGLWSAVRRLHAFCVGNMAIPTERNQFYRFITAGGNVRWNWYEESLETVQTSLKEWLAQ